MKPLRLAPGPKPSHHKERGRLLSNPARGVKNSRRSQAMPEANRPWMDAAFGAVNPPMIAIAVSRQPLDPRLYPDMHHGFGPIVANDDRSVSR